MSDKLKVIRLDQKANTSNRTVIQLLEDELARWKDPECQDEVPQKAVILYLNDDNGQYSIRWAQAGLRMSGCVTLCELGKEKFKDEMGY